MKHLVIAEKPSVGRDIGRVLHCTKKTNSYMEGSEYIVTWALGHLVTIADPEAYGPQYKAWNMETLPMVPKDWKLVVIRQTSKQYKVVKELLYRKDVSDVIIATDAGREGELVARWILDKSGCKKPLKRLWISSVTDKAILDGFKNLRPGKDYYNLYKAAVARAKSDWIVGINATRALTCKYNAQLSCGRVQTPTLAMIAAREEEIRSFKPKSYYGMKALAKGISFTWTDASSGSSSTFNHERIQELHHSLKGPLKIIEIKTKKKKSFSPALYDLTALQKDANLRFGFSPKETLNIMQRLYENHKVLTYPRTDSRYITTDVVDTLKERLQACAVGPYSKIAGRLSMQQIKPSKTFVDNSKVTDHHAIIPTEQFVQMDHMSNEEKKIYDMVVRRFLSVLMPASEYEETSIKAAIGTETFLAKGNRIITSGWKEACNEIFHDNENEEQPVFSSQNLPKLKTGDTLALTSLTITSGKTKAPAHFNEGTLVAAMENPVKYMKHKDNSLAHTLNETGGLGTVATRADIIDKLFKSFLMEKKGNDIFITSKGKQLLELVPEDLKKPELTASWEQRLQSIASGKESDKIFMDEIEQYTQNLIREIKSSTSTFHHDNLTRTKCPQCGKFMLEVNGKHGKMLVCQDRECGYRETISRHTNARCPVCHKKMELIGKGENQKFVCSCGHKEKLSAFEERKKKEKGASKKDVNNYLRKQEKEAREPVNNAFADAFSKLGL